MTPDAFSAFAAAPVSPAAQLPPGAAVSPDAPDAPASSGASVAGSPAEFAGGPTGHRAVDAALRSLENAAELSEAERIAAYEAAHRTLRETLSTIDDA